MSVEGHSPRSLSAMFWPLLIGVTNVVIAAVMNLGADHFSLLSLQTLGVLALVGGLLLLQVLLWSKAHAQLPISISYPLTTIMYPGFALLDYFDRGGFNWIQVTGVVIIVIALAALVQENKRVFV